MKTTLIMVMSLDAKITRGDEPKIYGWTSGEDRIYFSSLLEKSSLVIMGRKTFEASKKSPKLPAGRLQIVMTRNPDLYTNIPGKLEFTNESPELLVQRLEQQGFDQALLVGGGHINTIFFQKKLINELWVTVEPLLLGTGNRLVAEDELDVSLQLKKVEKLNSKGTLLLKYLVV